MILIKDNFNFGPFTFSVFSCFYYRSKKAQKENIKSCFRYINYIQVLHHDGIIINGTAGKKRIICDNVFQAIKIYNSYAKKEA